MEQTNYTGNESEAYQSLGSSSREEVILRTTQIAGVKSLAAVQQPESIVCLFDPNNDMC